ncbi:MAG: YHS domain-containing protein [Chloroflexota bacterium]
MTNTFRDPVCGMDVTSQEAAGTSEYHGTVYYFCSLGCKQTFEQQPEKYARRSEPAHAHGCC